MTKLEKLYSIIENSREVGVKLNKEVLQQVEELEEGIIVEEILPALTNQGFSDHSEETEETPDFESVSHKP